MSDPLVPGSLAVSQENLYCVEKSTVTDTLQNESQELEMQGHTFKAVIPESYHLPECMEPQKDWPCKQCWEKP